MKESYGEDLASYSGLEPYAGDGNIARVASARGNAGQNPNGMSLMSLEHHSLEGFKVRLLAIKGAVRQPSAIRM